MSKSLAGPNTFVDFPPQPSAPLFCQKITDKWMLAVGVGARAVLLRFSATSEASFGSWLPIPKQKPAIWMEGWKKNETEIWMEGRKKNATLVYCKHIKQSYISNNPTNKRTHTPAN